MIETVLGDELSRSKRALDTVAPVLAHMLANSGNSLVSDAVLARVRGMLNDIAQQLLAVHKGEGGEPFGDALNRLADHVASDAHVLAHLHATAIEAQLTERLSKISAVDPVLSGLLQELVASEDAETAETAMTALASQSRFVQTQRRMQYPITELPPEMLERVLRVWARITPVERDAEVTAAIRDLRADYDEASTRIGRIRRLISSMRGSAIAALELEHAGLALFASALAAQAGQTREHAVLACHECQAARLALSLRAAGLEEAAIARQFALLEPAERLLQGIGEISIARARVLLQQGDAESVPKVVR